jgi:hypothetical protein
MSDFDVAFGQASVPSHIVKRHPNSISVLACLLGGQQLFKLLITNARTFLERDSVGSDEEQCRDFDGNDFRYVTEGRDRKIEFSAAVVVALEAEIPQILFVSFHLNVSTPSEEGTSRRCGLRLRVTPLSGVIQKDVPRSSEIVIGSESRWRAQFGSLRNQIQDDAERIF